MEENKQGAEDTEFVTGFKTVGDYVQNGFAQLMSATRWANSFTAAYAPLGYEALSADHADVCATLKSNATDLFNALLSSQNLKGRSLGKEFELLPDINDVLVVSIDRDLAALDGKPTDEESSPVMIKVKPAPKQPTWNSSPTVCALQLGNTKMLAGKNVERPQLSFKDPVDNSTKTLWVPKLQEKPNNLKPLALMLQYNDNGEPVGYEHPYQVELDAFSPPAEWLAEDKDRGEAPPVEETPLTMVTTTTELSLLINHLKTVTEFAVDLEHHSYRTYQGITCLMQISTDSGGDFLVDTFTLREHLHRLNEVFTNPKILKIFHGADWDIIWLQRDLGVYVVGMADTYRAAVLLDIPQKSLNALTQKYCGIKLDKKFQLADWRMRPLPEELCEYARRDTHTLLRLWRLMKTELLNAAHGTQNLVKACFQHSKQVCLKTYVKPVLREDSHMDLYLRSKKTFNSKQMAALKNLYQWRDGVARLEDESTGYVLPNHMLLQIADAIPREMQGLLACCNPVPPLLKRHLLNVHMIVLRARDSVSLTSADEQVTPIIHVDTTIPAILLCVHDKIDDYSRDSVITQSKRNNIGPMRRQKKIHQRKPWSLETPPPTLKDMNSSEVTKRFISPFERLLLVKEYKEYIESKEETTA